MEPEQCAQVAAGHVARLYLICESKLVAFLGPMPKGLALVKVGQHPSFVSESGAFWAQLMQGQHCVFGHRALVTRACVVPQSVHVERKEKDFTIQSWEC
jgi:hypothetical protein